MPRSKKSKKTADNASPEQVEAQEISNSEEQTPATIVEAGMEEVFASPEIVNEQPAPAKPKVSKRPYIADVEILLSAGTHTKKAMLEFIMEKYPAVSKGGASTFITDLCNIKYNHFKPRAVIKLAEGKLQFADMVPAAAKLPAHEEQTTDVPPESPAE